MEFSKNPVDIWTVLIVGILIAKVVLHKPYAFPGEVLSSYITVLSIMAITRKSKSMKAACELSENENSKLLG